MTFSPTAGASPRENQVIVFSPKTQNSKGFWSSLFLIPFLSSQKKTGFRFNKNDTSFYTDADKVI